MGNKERERPPRKSKSGPYQLTNAYSQPFSIEQIVTVIIYLIQLAAYCVFIIPALSAIRSELLWVLLGFHFALVAAVAYDYVGLTRGDPVDQLLLHEELSVKYPPEELVMCILCNGQVQRTSHHCMKCDRCTEDFDHHCKFLNNCIGGRNYEAFFRLLTNYVVYNLNLIGQAIWVAVKGFQGTAEAFSGSRWGVIALIVLSFFILLMVTALMGFHCYISCCEGTTTFQHMYPPTRHDSDPIQHINVNLWQTPLSAERLPRTN